MNKNTKHIIDSYKSVEIPEIDLESKIIKEIRMKDSNKLKFNLRTALIICLVLVITSTVVFALSRIIHNADGSHTLVSESEDTSWSVNSSEWENRYDRDEVKMMEKLFDEMYKLEAVGDEAVVGYLKYSEDKPEIFTVLTAEDTYRYGDDTLDVLRTHKDTPDYTYDIITKLQDEFRINKITYAYGVDPEMIEAIKIESKSRSIFGEAYADVIPVKRKFRSLQFDLFSNDMDKYISIYI